MHFQDLCRGGQRRAQVRGEGARAGPLGVENMIVGVSTHLEHAWLALRSCTTVTCANLGSRDVRRHLAKPAASAAFRRHRTRLEWLVPVLPHQQLGQVGRRRAALLRKEGHLRGQQLHVREGDPGRPALEGGVRCGCTLRTGAWSWVCVR